MPKLLNLAKAMGIFEDYQPESDAEVVRSAADSNNKQAGDPNTEASRFLEHANALKVAKIELAEAEKAFRLSEGRLAASGPWCRMPLHVGIALRKQLIAAEEVMASTKAEVESLQSEVDAYLAKCAAAGRFGFTSAKRS